MQRVGAAREVRAASQVLVTVACPGGERLLLAVERDCLLASARSALPAQQQQQPPPTDRVVPLIHVDTPEAADIVARLCEFVTALRESGHMRALELPRCAWENGLRDAIGSAAWRRLRALLDGDGKAPVAAAAAASSPPPLSGPERAAAAFGIAQAAGLHEAVCDVLLWEIARRMRYCTDTAQVAADFGVDEKLIAADDVTAAVRQAAPLLFEERPFVASPAQMARRHTARGGVDAHDGGGDSAIDDASGDDDDLDDEEHDEEVGDANGRPGA
jgi:hypothetical protein